MASAFKRDGKWVAKYRDAAGKKRQVRTEFSTKAPALQLACELEEKARRQRGGLEPLPDGSAPLTFGAAFDWWHAEYGVHLRSQSIIGMAKKNLLPTLGPLLLGAVTPDALEGLLNGKRRSLS